MRRLFPARESIPQGFDALGSRRVWTVESAPPAHVYCERIPWEWLWKSANHRFAFGDLVAFAVASEVRLPGLLAAEFGCVFLTRRGGRTHHRTGFRV